MSCEKILISIIYLLSLTKIDPKAEKLVNP